MLDKNKLMTFNDNIDYMFHANIVEYDMVSASVSVCERYKLLDPTTIQRLKLLPKEKRTREMGMMQKDSVFSEKMLNGLRETREIFIKENHIKDDDILSLHSDALFFNIKDDVKENVNGVEFKIKNRYCSYLKYDKKIEMFYTGEYIDYKNIPKDMVRQHTLGINKYLLNVFNKLENYDDSILEDISKFQSKYLQDKLFDFYYIPFGNVSGTYKLENLKLFAFIANVTYKEIRSW